MARDTALRLVQARDRPFSPVETFAPLRFAPVAERIPLTLALALDLLHPWPSRLPRRSTTGRRRRPGPALPPRHTACWVSRGATRGEVPGPAMTAILAGLRVLVVEDHEDSRDALIALLRRHGALVQGAAHGREALACLAAERPDAMLVDIAMPEIGGYELLRRLEVLEEMRDLPVLVVSGQPVDQTRCRQMGVRAWLRKPVEPDALVRTLATVRPSRAPGPEDGSPRGASLVTRR